MRAVQGIIFLSNEVECLGVPEVAVGGYLESTSTDQDRDRTNAEPAGGDQLPWRTCVSPGTLKEHQLVEFHFMLEADQYSLLLSPHVMMHDSQAYSIRSQDDTTCAIHVALVSG